MNTDDKNIERILKRYRPIGPPSTLRARIFDPPEPKSTRPKGTVVFVVAILGTVLAGMVMRSRVTDLAPEDDRPTEDRMALRYSLVFTPEEPISELRKLVEDDET